MCYTRQMRSIAELTNIEGKRVIVRVDVNVPVLDGAVTDAEAYRIHAILPTINYLLEQKAKVILISHIGRKGETLRPVAKYIEKVFPCTFVPAVTGKTVTDAIDVMQNGTVILLENVRTCPGEEANDVGFAQILASYADIYVNDAFAVSHRAHASLVGVPKLLPSYAGFLMLREIKELNKVLHPEHPMHCVLSGAKPETKLPVIEKMLTIADKLYIGGQLASTFIKARGYEVGTSIVGEVSNIVHIQNHPKIVLPVDVVVQHADKSVSTVSIRDVLKTDNIVDVGFESIKQWHHEMHEAKVIVLNGFLGWDGGGFMTGTKELLQAVVPLSAYTILGGGDSVSYVRWLGFDDAFNFLSTGGGAMLEFIANSGNLPGITALG